MKTLLTILPRPLVVFAVAYGSVIKRLVLAGAVVIFSILITPVVKESVTWHEWVDDSTATTMSFWVSSLFSGLALFLFIFLIAMVIGFLKFLIGLYKEADETVPRRKAN